MSTLTKIVQRTVGEIRRVNILVLMASVEKQT
jgi:hypothetical protein